MTYINNPFNLNRGGQVSAAALSDILDRIGKGAGSKAFWPLFEELSLIDGGPFYKG